MPSFIERMIRVAGAALVVAPALALAQAGMPPGQRPRPTPAPTAPATTPHTAAGTEPGGESKAQVTGALQALRGLDAFAIQAGTLATQRASNAHLKDFAGRMVKDHQNLDAGLVRFATQRSLALGAKPQMAGNDTAAVQSLEKLQGSNFDREFTDNNVSRHEQYVQELKDLRDQTPGKDAELKKWLDDAENVEEGHLTELRQIRQQMRDQSRQARTPPSQ